MKVVEQFASNVNPATVRLVARALEDDDSGVRRAAEQTLARMIPPAARLTAGSGLMGTNPMLEPLFADLDSTDFGHRSSARKALCLLGIVEPLVEALRNEDGRHSLVEALEKLTGEAASRAARALVHQLSASKGITHETLWLGYDPSEVKAQKETNFLRMRQAMVRILGVLGVPSAEDTLWRGRNHWDEGVRDEAEQALQKLKAKSAK
jgi:HEAT repeat protein